jgi:hypothetical protein
MCTRLNILAVSISELSCQNALLILQCNFLTIYNVDHVLTCYLKINKFIELVVRQFSAIYFLLKNENPAFPLRSFDKFMVPNRTCPCSTIVSVAGCNLIS